MEQYNRPRGNPELLLDNTPYREEDCCRDWDYQIERNIKFSKRRKVHSMATLHTLFAKKKSMKFVLKFQNIYYIIYIFEINLPMFTYFQSLFSRMALIRKEQ